MNGVQDTYPQYAQQVGTLAHTLRHRYRLQLSGNLLVILICSLDVLDWFLIKSDVTGTHTAGDASRLAPHLARIGLLLFTFFIVLSFWKRVHRLKLFWMQAAWLCLIVLRYLLVGEFDAQALLHCAIFAFTPLALWSFFVIARTGQLDLKFLTRAGALMVTLYGLRILLFHIGLFLGSADTFDEEIGAIKTSGYEMLLFLSWFLLGRYKVSKLWFVLVAMLVSALCMERSTQLEVVFGLPILLFSYLQTQPRRRKVMLGISLAAIAMFAATYALNARNINARWGELASGGDETGSGRLDIWTILLNNWWHGDTFARLLGFGQDSVYKATSTQWNAGLVHAHNEWIQMLYETGLFGALCYAGIIVLLWKNTVDLFRAKRPGAIAALFATSVVTCRSFFDFFLNSSSASLFGVCIGVAMGMTLSRSQVSRMEEYDAGACSPGETGFEALEGGSVPEIIMG